MHELAGAAAAIALVTLAAGIQGFVGFGYGIVAMSTLTFADDLLHAAGVVNLTGVLISLAQLHQLRRHVMLKPALRILPWLLVGLVAGVSALRVIDRGVMIRLLGITVAALAVLNLTKPVVHFREAKRWDALAGLASGMLGGAFNTGGPPLVAHLYRRPEPPDALKGTVQLLFLTMSATRIPIAAAQGLFDAAILRDATYAAPGALLGLFVGLWLGRRVHPERFRTVSWVAFGVLGIALILAS